MNTAALQESLARAEANFQAEDSLDVNLLDQVMEIMNGCQGELQQKANLLLVALQNAPDTWRKVDMILEYSKSMETRYFGLQILENTIKTRWRALPAEQREGVKSFVAGMIMKLCKQDDQPSALLLQKVNVVLVQIVKQDWPRNWPTFMPDLIRSAETDQRVCVNSMKVLGLLSEDVFDFGCQSLTQAKENYLKENFCGQFQDVFNFCLRLMKECPADDIVKANLKTIRRFMTWIPVTFIYDTDVLPLLTDRFLPLDAYRLPGLQCLTEVSSITNLTEAYKSKLRSTFFSAIKVLAEFIGPSFDMSEAYARGNEEDQRFVTSLADFLVAFLKNNAELVEVFKENGSMEMELHNYAIQLLLSLSTVDDVEIFKVCLEFWLQLTQDLYRVDPFTKPHHMHFPGVNLPVHLREHPRKELYRNHLSHLRTIIIGRMAKPEEVLVVENEQGEVVRELVKDTDAITLYKTMRETLVFLTHLDSKDTEAKMTEKLAAQVSGGEFSWKSLNTLCWAVGSISMTMPEEDEKRFLVLVIRDLLGLCEQKRGKDNKAVIASNIMYIVGQYPRFLRAHWKFLKTVVNKLFEFMHESHEGVQDMACDTFIKIAIKCKRHFTIIQMGESEPFVDEMLTNLNGNICDLSPPQVHVFYEAMGHIISSKSEPEEQKNLISRLMQPPNNNWDEIIISASSDVGCLGDVEMLKSIANILKTNTAACKSIGGSFYSQLSRNFNDMLCLYRILSEQVSEAIKTQGEEILKNPVVKQIRAVKKEILILISTWSSKAEVATELRETVVPQLFDAVLFDYQKNVPQAREPKVLSLLAIIVAQLQEHTYPFVAHILESVFGCTLEMINKDFESFPEHRVNFFHLLMSLIQECFPVIIKLSKSELDYIVSAIVWAFQHSLRAVAELGLDIVREILERAPHMSSSEDRAAAQLFYQNHFMVIMEHLLAIAADSSQVHVAGLTYYADVLCCLFRAAEHQITVPLNPNNPSQSNLDYVSECITTLFHNHYSNNLNSDQIRVFVKGFFSYNGEVASMRNHLRDFLIQIKECKGEDTADLFLEEKEAQIMAIQEQKYKVPGLMNPNEIVDDEDMEFNRASIDLEARGRRIRLGPRKNDAPEEQFAQVF